MLKLNALPVPLLRQVRRLANDGKRWSRSWVLFLGIRGGAGGEGAGARSGRRLANDGKRWSRWTFQETFKFIPWNKRGGAGGEGAGSRSGSDAGEVILLVIFVTFFGAVFGAVFRVFLMFEIVPLGDF